MEGLLADIDKHRQELEAQREFEDNTLNDLRTEARAFLSYRNGPNDRASNKKARQKK
jgi:hypothetical protein